MLRICMFFFVFLCGEWVESGIDLIFGSDDKYPCTLILMMHCILFTLSDPNVNSYYILVTVCLY